MRLRFARHILPALAVLSVLAVAVWWAGRSEPTGTRAASRRAAVRALELQWDVAEAAPPVGAVGGEVLLSSGAPASGVRVTLTAALADRLRSPTWPVAVRAEVTSAEGRFTFQDVPRGLYTVAASAPAGVALPLNVEVQGGDHARVPVRLSAPSLAVRGAVRSEGGAAIGGAVLLARPLTPGAASVEVASYEAHADEAGAYTLWLPAGLHEVQVRAPGHAPHSQRLVVARVLEHDVWLLPEAVLAGHLRSAGGAPVPAGAEVRLLGGAEALVVPAVRSDAGGGFRFEGLAPGRYQVLARAGALVGLSEGVETGRGDLQVQLTPGRQLQGRVLQPDGAQAGGARVWLQSLDPLVPLAVVGHAEADGAFRFEGLLEGRYRVGALGRDGELAETELTLAGAPAPDVQLHLQPTAELTVSVRAPEGSPAAGARVQLELRGGSFPSRPARVGLADGQGQLLFTGLPGGQALLSASHAVAGAAQEGPLMLEAGGSEHVTLSTTAAAPTVEGTVRWRDGTPAAGVPVVAVPRWGGGAAAVALTGAQGDYVLGPLAAGELRVVVAPGGVWLQALDALARHVTVSPGRAERGVDFSVARDAVAEAARAARTPSAPPPGEDVAATDVSGVVVGRGGLPVTEYSLSAVRQPSARAGAASTAQGRPEGAASMRVRSERGAFRLGPLSPGRYRLLAAAADGRVGGALVEVPLRDQPSGLRIQLSEPPVPSDR